ncbi:MAG: glycosyltransferase family 39 protein [Nitrospirota bacterium]
MKKTFLTILAFLLVFYLPFINKAVHIDDGNFIEMSKAMDFPLSVKPGYIYYFMGNRTDNYSPFDSTHPPFIPFYLKLISSAAGGYKDYLLHAGFLIFPVLLLLSTVLLAKELGVDQTAAVMFICGNAALLPVSHNLMADLPMFSLWMLASYFFITGIKRDIRCRMVSAFLVITIAALMSYQTIFLLPAFFIYVVSNNKVNNKMMVFFSIPVAAITLVLLYIAAHYPSPVSGIINEVKRGLEPDRIFNKGMSIPLYTGLSAVFLLPMKYREIKSTKKNYFLALFSVLVVIPPVLTLSYSLWSSLWLIILASSGIFSLIFATRIVRDNIDDRPINFFFLTWIVLVLFYNILFMPFGAFRYIMPVIAPLTFIFLKNTPRTKALMMSGVLTALLGFAVACGDYIYASSYRDFSDEVRKTVGRSGDRVWYIGEWGMHYYMDKNGFRYLTAGANEPGEGDLIIIADIPKLWGPSPELYSRMKLIDVRETRTWYPVRVMGLHVRAGYYSSLWGYLPFAISVQPIERFGIFRVIM